MTDALVERDILLVGQDERNLLDMVTVFATLLGAELFDFRTTHLGGYFHMEGYALLLELIVEVDHQHITHSTRVAPRRFFLNGNLANIFAIIDDYIAIWVSNLAHFFVILYAIGRGVSRANESLVLLVVDAQQIYSVMHGKDIVWITEIDSCIFVELVEQQLLSKQQHGLQ